MWCIVLGTMMLTMRMMMMMMMIIIMVKKKGKEMIDPGVDNTGGVFAFPIIHHAFDATIIQGVLMWIRSSPEHNHNQNLRLPLEQQQIQ